MKPKFPIDIVLPWVDGTDPVHQRKRMSYVTARREDLFEDTGGNSRYESVGEIIHCLASINIHAPFIRKIFIVTDNQDPDADRIMSEMFPEGHIPMETIDHRIIFEGYEEYLPTFNSRAIETMIWRIPGLSEHFILMNDDFMLLNNVSPEDFFREEDVICYARKRSAVWARLMLRCRPERQHKHVSFKGSMLNALDYIGPRRRYIHLSHAPRALRKSFFVGFFAAHPEAIIRNISHRFRNPEQFNMQELFYMSESEKGKCVLISPRGKVLYMIPKKDSRYIERKLRSFSRCRKALFCCANSLPVAEPQDREKVLGWMKEHIDQNLRCSL